MSPKDEIFLKITFVKCYFPSILPLFI